MAELRDILDRAIAVGALMGEEKNLVGMGLVAASALNRAQNPTAYLSRSASLGDIFSAPHKASSMVGSVLGRNSLPDTGLARQYSTTLNTPQTKNAYDAFSLGVKATLGMTQDLGPFDERFQKANIALDVAMKAQDLGIDLGYGATNYGVKGAAAARAGVGKNPAQFGSHALGPFAPGSVPAPQDFAARFAAAAAMTGVEIPQEYQQEVSKFATPAQISAAASTLQMQAQQHLGSLGVEAMPGVNYNDLVGPMGFGAVDVPDVTNKLGIGAGPNALGLGDNFGITPTNDYEAIGLPDPVGQVSFAGNLPDITPASAGFSLGQGQFNDIFNAGFPEQAPSWDLTGATLPDYATPDMFSAPMDQSTFNDVFDAGFPSAPAPSPMDASTFNDVFSQGFPNEAPAAPMSGSTFDAIQSAGFPNDQPQGFSAGFDAGPYGQTPDFSAPSLEARNAQAFAADAAKNLASNINSIEQSLGANQMEQQAQAAARNGPFDLSGFKAADLSDLAMGAPVGAAAFGGIPSAQTADFSTPQLATPSLSQGAFNDIFDAGFPPGPSFGSLPSLAAAPLSAPSFSPPQAPTTTATVSPNVPAQGDIDIGAPPSVRTSSLPDTAPLPPSRPVDDASFGPFGWNDKTGLTIGGFGSPVDAIKSGLGLGMPNDAFMNAMASPQYANAYSPGFLDGPFGRTAIGAAKGAMFGGIPGAVLGGAFGGLGWGNAMSNQFDNFFGGMLDHAMQGWDGYDFSTHGYGPGFNERGERSPTTRDESGNATMGDGSYSETSGRNDNNPQGIL